MVGSAENAIVDPGKLLFTGVVSQDGHINDIRKELTEVQLQKNGIQRQFDDAVEQIQQLKDQNSLLKAQRSTKHY